MEFQSEVITACVVDQACCALLLMARRFDVALWLESLAGGWEVDAPHFEKHGISTPEQLAQLTEEDLRGMGAFNDSEVQFYLGVVGLLKGKTEEQVLEELPVSCTHK